MPIPRFSSARKRRTLGSDNSEDADANFTDANDDEESPLLVAPTVRMRQNHRGVVWNRIALVVLTVTLGALALGGELQISQLTLQLEQHDAQISQLQQTVSEHQHVIQRFNSSITNADVMKRVQQLQKKLGNTVDDWMRALNETQHFVETELAQTIRQLNTTVVAAETEISQQVDRVKKDVEQYVITTQDQFSMENSFMVYQLAGTFTLLSCLISMWHMSAHLRKLLQPQVQRKILAILWMSPIYAITSWFSLVFPSAEGYLAIVKDFYEAYVIYQFLSFCIAVLGKGDRATVVDLLANHAEHLTPPFRLCSVWEICCSCCRPDPYESNRQLADEILLQCQLFAMQFVFFRPMTTTAMVVLAKLEYFGPYGATSATDYRAPQFYIVIVQNISIFVAFTGLLKFYHAVDKELAWCRPFAKFLCIKGVVFMTFWQGLAISILAQTTDLGGSGGNPDEWAKSAQNFLICLEMLLFSIAHFYCFPTEEWEEGYRVKHSQGKFGDSIALGDFFDDLKLILKANVKKRSSNNTAHNKSKKNLLHEQPSIPESAEEDDDTTASNEDDEESGTNRRSSSSTRETHVGDVADEAERALVAALEKSLGSVNDDPDIVEAKQRLLQSNVLSPDFFCDDESSIDGDEDEQDDIDAAVGAAQHLWKSDYVNTDEDTLPVDDVKSNATPHAVSAAPLGSPPPPRNPPPPPPTELTGLLSPSAWNSTMSYQNEPFIGTATAHTQATEQHLLKQQYEDGGFVEALRPSIFTTVASIAELERRRSEEHDEVVTSSRSRS